MILRLSKFRSIRYDSPLKKYLSLLSPRSSRSRTMYLPSLLGKPTIVLSGPFTQRSISTPELSSQFIVIKNSTSGSILPSSAIGLIRRNAIRSKLVKPIKRLNKRSVKAIFELYFLI